MRQALSTRTVLLRMAADEERAARIRGYKAERPDLTWPLVAERVGVTERSVHAWARKGALSYENAKKLAGVFEVDVDELWRGDRGPTPDLSVVPRSRDDRLEQRLAEVERKLDRQYEILGDIFRALGGEPGWEERISRAGRELGELSRDTPPAQPERPTGTNGLRGRPPGD